MIEIDETVKEPKRQFSEYEAVGGFRQGFLMVMKTEINAKEGQEIIRGKDRGYREIVLALFWIETEWSPEQKGDSSHRHTDQ